MAMFSDGADLPLGPEQASAPLRRRHRRLSALAPWADTQMPQGQMVSGIYVPAGPVASFTAAVKQGLGTAGAINARRDENDAAAGAAEMAAADKEHKRLQWDQRMALDYEQLEQQKARSGAEQSRFERSQAGEEADRQARAERAAKEQEYRERDLGFRERQLEGLSGHREAMEELRRIDQRLREEELRRKGVGRKAGKSAAAPQTVRPSAPLRRKAGPNVDDILKQYGE